MLLPIWNEAAERHGESVPGGVRIGSIPPPRWSEELHLATMDDHGIRASVLSWPRGTSFLSGEAASTMARAMNEELAAIVARRPDRFGALAVLPLDDPRARIDETIDALDRLGLDGISCPSNIGGRHLGDPVFDEWMHELDRRDAVLFVHPSLPANFQQVAMGLNPAILEFMFDTTRMATNMVLSGTKRKFPRVKVICTHAGGAMPYLAPRIGILEPIFGAGPGRPVLSEEEVLAELGTFYFDLTASTTASTLDALRHLVPASRILSGFDFPMMPETTIAPAIERFLAYPGFTEQERRLIASDNALSLFPRLAAAIGKPIQTV